MARVGGATVIRHCVQVVHHIMTVGHVWAEIKVCQRELDTCVQLRPKPFTGGESLQMKYKNFGTPVDGEAFRAFLAGLAVRASRLLITIQHFFFGEQAQALLESDRVRALGYWEGEVPEGVKGHRFVATDTALERAFQLADEAINNLAVIVSQISFPGLGCFLGLAEIVIYLCGEVPRPRGDAVNILMEALQ